MTVQKEEKEKTARHVPGYTLEHVFGTHLVLELLPAAALRYLDQSVPEPPVRPPSIPHFTPGTTELQATSYRKQPSQTTPTIKGAAPRDEFSEQLARGFPSTRWFLFPIEERLFFLGHSVKCSLFFFIPIHVLSERQSELEFEWEFVSIGTFEDSPISRQTG